MRSRALFLGVLLAVSAAGASCKSGDDGGPQPSPTPTVPPNVNYWSHVAPIVNAQCVGCHTAGGIAPFELGTYAQAYAYGALIKGATAIRTMPPQPIDASGACHDFSDARWLSDIEIATIGAWVDAGMPEGNIADAPPAPTPLPTLGTPDLTLDMGVAYAPQLTPDEYRCFLVDPGTAANSYVTAYEVLPGNAAIVHHVVLFTLASAAAQTAAENLDAGEAGDGYTCFGGAQVSASIVGVWAPGTGATFFPANTGLLLPGNRKVVMQVHYNLAATGPTDRTRIALRTAASVTKPAQILAVGTSGFTLPANSTPSESVQQTSPGNATVYSVYPHMHTYGRTISLTQNGTCALDVPRWNFGWQQFYTYSTPLQVQAGDTIRLTCTWDTTGAPGPVSSGEGTGDEMCGVGLYVTVP